MADLITTGTSDYAVGGIDSATVLLPAVSPISAKHPNGIASAVVQIETILGSGTTLKGTQADLAARLAVGVNSTGTLKTTTLDGINTVAQGGTGRGTLTADKLLLGAGTSAVAYASGLLYEGPTSTGTGSAQTHGGTVTLSTNQAFQGIHFYTDFTLNTGVTLTLDNNSHRLVIIATGTITINGTIDAIGAGSQGGAAGVSAAGGAGDAGYSQPGGGGGAGDTGTPGGAGGAMLLHGITKASGGAGGSGANGPGGAGTQQTGEALGISDPFSIMGGSGGGGGGDGTVGTAGAGGRAGGSVILVAPNIILGAASSINTSGSNGGAPSNNEGGGGGGGGAGNFYVFCRTYTNNGCTFTQTGGTGGNSPTAGDGAAGRAGVKQINIYA